MTQPPRLFDQVKPIARLKHLNLKTEKSCLFYIRDFILFRKKRHPKEMGLDEIRTYLSNVTLPHQSKQFH
jgi:Phage integrase, N-terminal SAM-like domain